MSFLFPKAPSPTLPPKRPDPNQALANVDREAEMIRRRKGRASTILSDETLGATKMNQGLKTFMGQ